MLMYRVISWFVVKGCFLWPVCSLDKTLVMFTLLHFSLQGQICLLFWVPVIEESWVLWELQGLTGEDGTGVPNKWKSITQSWMHLKKWQVFSVAEILVKFKRDKPGRLLKRCDIYLQWSVTKLQNVKYCHFWQHWSI